MKKHYFIFLLILVLFGCNSQSELILPESMKPADKFARNFIDKIIKGEIESSFADIDPEILNDEAKEFINNASKNINREKVRKYKYAEVSGKSFYTTNGSYTIYQLGYEYEFNQGFILFKTTVREINGKYLIESFNGENLKAPLAELTKFTFSGKNPLQYIFLVLAIFVPLFIIFSFIAMLLSKMTVKKKILWSFIILLVSLPRFVIDWGIGAVDFNLLNISLLGFGFSKPALYSAWLISFSIPIGAIIYWVKRESLLPDEEIYSISETKIDENKNGR